MAQKEVCTHNEYKPLFVYKFIAGRRRDARCYCKTQLFWVYYEKRL